MLSLAPALADPPVVLIADEPTLGLAPLAADVVMDAILELRDRACAVLLVEEHAQNALARRRHARVHGARQHRVDRLRDEADMGLLTSGVPRRECLTLDSDCWLSVGCARCFLRSTLAVKRW